MKPFRCLLCGGGGTLGNLLRKVGDARVTPGYWVHVRPCQLRMELGA